MKKLTLIIMLTVFPLLGCDDNSNVQQGIDKTKASAAQVAADIKDTADAVVISAKETVQEASETIEGKAGDVMATANAEIQDMKGKVDAIKEILINDHNTVLMSNHWHLASAQNAQGQRIDALFVQPDKPVQFDFDRERISIGNACNAIGGSYTVQGQQITFDMLSATKRACADNQINRLDQEISSRLNAPATFALTPNELKLTTTSGDVLTFSASPTAETRFGNTGETVFLEIAPQRQVCSHPLAPNQQCLMVREVRYAENGMKSYPSESWEPLYQEIEGYTHEPDLRNIVRAKRFIIANSPDNTPNTAYVLDMVIESERVPAQ